MIRTTRATSLLLVALSVALSVTPARAYYHFVHYTTRSAPYGIAQEKYDLSALPNKTVSVYVNDQTAAVLVQPDAFPSVLNAIREATRVWNGVDTSDLRVAFGGLESAGTPQNTPGVDFQFEDLDPLTLGLTALSTSRTLSFGPSGAFFPVSRGLIRLNRDLNAWRGPNVSVTEGFFLTVVHEMGHSLGLQHTYTSSTMATEVTRASTMARPIDADDRAGVSVLYPSASFAQSTGTITGRVTAANGQPLHMASVVAIRPTGSAVSALTDPDGRYRIDGLPVLDSSGARAQYVVYAHPVPPSRRPGAPVGDIVPPQDPDGRSISADGPFDTQFYQVGGVTRDPQQASQVAVIAGSSVDNINFNLNRRATFSIPAVSTYSFFDQTAVRPGYLNGGGTLVASGAGLTSNGQPAPGLNVSFIGGSPVLAGIRAYAGSYLALDLQPASTFGATGPRHVVFALPSDIYVLPYGMTLVQNRPPSIVSVTPGFEPNGSRSVALAGTSLAPDTKFYFDGAPGTLLRFDDSGRAVVAPPPGLSGRNAVLTAFDSDGQNSMFLQSGTPPSYVYDTGDPGSVTLAPGSISAGSETLIDIAGAGTNFVDGLTALGMGSSDVQVRRLSVLSPTHLLANVYVVPGAALAGTEVTVITGYQVISQPFGFQIQASNGRSPTVSSQLVNASGSGSGIFPGATVTMSGVNLTGALLTVSDRPVTILAANANQVTFQVPLGLTTGPAILKVTTSADTVDIMINIDGPPPGIFGVTLGGIALDVNHPAHAGDVLSVAASGLGDPNTSVASYRVRVNVGGIDHQVAAIYPSAAGQQVQFVLSPLVVPATQVPLTVSLDGRPSLAATIAVRGQ